MQTVKTRRLDADAVGVATAAKLLRDGCLVAFGTETVYGLGADATRGQAIEAIFAAKGRPRSNPLIAHFADAEAAFREVRSSPLAISLGDRFWPGPLTLVLPRRADGSICARATAGLATAAVRVPSGTVAQALLRQAGRPIAAPSANPSGRVSPTDAQHVLDGLAGRIDAVLDCGPCPVGLESTVLALDGEIATLLRPGGITVEAIAAALSDLGVPGLRFPGLRFPGLQFPGRLAGRQPTRAEADARPISPGMLASHYAPRVPVRLDATAVASDEALLAFGQELPGSGASWNLSETSDLAEAASRLFAGLRCLDACAESLGLARIAVMPIPIDGLGRAIADRLQRAASRRPD